MPSLGTRSSPAAWGRTLLQLARGAVRRALPRPIHARLRRQLGEVVLMCALTKLKREPERILHDIGLARLLYYGWSSGWCASPEYLQRASQLSVAQRGPVLECGCGLSTLVLGLVAQSIGQSVLSLEHAEQFASRVRRYLARFSISCVNLHVAPLRSYGDFDWYALPSVALPRDFALVVCDGPPGGTRGGRVGLLPVLRSSLRTDCVVLLDDAERSGERQVLATWRQLVSLSVKIHETEKPFAEIALT